MYKDGFIKVSSITPKLVVGNPMENVKEMLKCLENNTSSLALFPELAITGYTCGDLFFQDSLLTDAYHAIQYFIDHHHFKGIIIFGSPIIVDTYLYNCAVVVQNKKILGIVPKKYIPNNYEFYEKRWFRTGLTVKSRQINFLGQQTFFGDIMFSNFHHDLNLGIEICEDMWSLTPPGSFYSMNGVNVMCNISASNDTLGKNKVRRNSVLENSRRNVGAYIYVSAGPSESSSETTFSGHDMICYNGSMLAETEIEDLDSHILYADIDISGLNFLRRNSSHLKEYVNIPPVINVPFELEETKEYVFETPFSKYPFIPSDMEEREIFDQIASIQEIALMKRLTHLNMKSVVIGVSGGLDSTLALLVAAHTFRRMNLDPKGIIAVTMPSSHSSSRTKSNAMALMEALHCTVKNIPIKEAVDQHFDMISHDPKNENATYENAQARMRTLILMDLANDNNAIVLGTGDMSELALGFCTYNGDQMSMYGINAGLPKTVVRFCVNGYAKYIYKELDTVLSDIIHTPISPELKDSQETEDLIGSYEINDFILFRYLNYGDTKEKLKKLLALTFDMNCDQYVEDFFRRFFASQFKRQSLPDGPKVFNVSLAPRGDYRMPSDIKR